MIAGEVRSLKKGLCLLVGTVMVAASATPSYSQTASSSAALARGETSEVRVAAIIAPPNVIMEKNGTLTGFSVDLWNAIAARLKLQTSYQIMPDVGALDEAMRSKRVDLAIGLFITSARDEVFDFSFPTLQAGLQIMVRDTGQTTQTASPLRDMLRLLFSRTTVVWLGIALVLVLIPAHLVWLFERRRPDGIISSSNYFPGIFEAFFWAISTLTGSPEGMPHQWVARMFAIFWIFAGVVFVAFYTAQLTTTLTVEQIRGAIEGPADLPGKQVATIAGSTAADYLRQQNAQVQEFQTTDQVYKALLDKKVDAVVLPAPMLLYYASHEGKGQVKMVGPEFSTAPAAIMVQLDSPLRRKINLALIALRENGTYQQIYDKWFGNP
jgi:polar amino acid transport system substrate-binding protein